MKENTYRSSKIIIFSLMVVAIVAVFAVVIALTWGRDMPTGADTEKIDIDDTSNDTETEPLDIITDTVSDTGDIDTQPPPPTDENEKKQAQLDKCVDEISLWINDAVPRYEKAEETDVEGNVIVPAELYSPPVAFFYQDLYSGCTMEYNADRVFYTASIIKEPYVMWALCEIEKAEYEGVTEGTKFDLGSTFIYTEDKFKSGSGII
ncbi:MAG: serine hydrolase, partial [Clostridia bacterium]|nr:serine hydrolase [Clostridia bacterium]